MPLVNEESVEAEGASNVKEGPVKTQRGVVTSDIILRTGLRLMAENGYNGVSLRRICLEAEVNLALMNYHFGTKDQLLLAIFQKVGAPINAERVRMLEEVERRYEGRKAPLEALLEAFIVPTFSISQAEQEDELNFLRLSGRIATDPTPEVRKVVDAVYDSGALRFVRAVRSSCPHLSNDEFYSRMIFLYGAMVYTRADTGRVVSLAAKLDEAVDLISMEEVCQDMVTFLAAGFRAPARRRGQAS